MPIHKSFSQERIDSLRDWVARTSIPGIEQPVYVGILDHVLRLQDSAGFWNIEGEKWQCVMTGVVLKALAELKFNATNRWSRKDGSYGGVEPAVKYLATAVEAAKGNPGSGAIGEDIWDACQTLLALAEYEPNSRPAIDVARKINNDWQLIYDNERARSDRAEWCGPAYLGTMVDVLAEYESDIGKDSEGKDSKYFDALSILKDSEAKDDQGKVLGHFAADNGDGLITLWNTGLVLRTLVAAPEMKIDRVQVERIVAWLLASPQNKLHASAGGRSPMYLARTLHALLDARPWCKTSTQEGINNALRSGNAQLSDYFTASAGPTGNLKSYTAVVEYLAAWRIPAPAGLLFEANKTLGTAAVFRPEPIPRENGLRIVWLSDLHLASEHDFPGKLSRTERFFASLNPLQGHAESWMRFKGTPITQHFATKNLATILRRVATLKPRHILVTGDVTNYARESQFDEARTLFLDTQRAITNEQNDHLDPELWTILPGNHDITNERPMAGIPKTNLGMFFQKFGDTFGSKRPNFSFSNAFPLVKELPGSDEKVFVRLIGLDSNSPHPVWVVGVNATGNIDDEQMTRLDDVLGAKTKAAMTLLTLHHHPIVVPELASELEDYFLALNDTDGRKLIKRCANNRVSAILHGHFHAYSSWSGLTPTQRQLAIIGSPAGTITIPDTHTEEFLELCEADREIQDGVEGGLALYRHRLGPAGWTATYAGVFLPVVPVVA
jgi:3',5'-cyclic AMP phosphodiesterase CpdA